MALRASDVRAWLRFIREARRAWWLYLQAQAEKGADDPLCKLRERAGVECLPGFGAGPVRWMGAAA